jgi:MYXO-CTERM domain-containing protein
VGLPTDIGLTFLLPSTEGSGSIGTASGYFWSQVGANPPILANQLGLYNSYADRVTTVPTPGALPLMGICAFAATRRRRQ